MKKRLTFRGIETCDLDNVVTLRPPELVHLLLGAKAPELSHVELRIPVSSQSDKDPHTIGRHLPRVQVLVETIKPKYSAMDQITSADRIRPTYQSVAAPKSANFSMGTSLGTNLLTGWPAQMNRVSFLFKNK